MSTSQSTIDYLLEQLDSLDGISTRKMFGEYALYFEGKVVALCCDDALYVKPTGAGKAFLIEVVEAPPYPKAKPYFLIEADAWEDASRLCQLIRITAQNLPMPKPKARKKSRTIAT
jgi:TfoX/Sxy family transcriptional regulator of competence genes